MMLAIDALPRRRHEDLAKGCRHLTRTFRLRDDEPGDDALALRADVQQRGLGLGRLFGLAFVTHGLVHCAPCWWCAVEGPAAALEDERGGC